MPPDFREMIVDAIEGQDSLWGRTRQMTTSTNSITFPVDATAPWDAANGPQVVNLLEGAQKPPSKPSLTPFTTAVHKSIALVPMTDELLEDAPALNAYMRAEMPQRFAHHINNLLINGTGVNQAQGILVSGEKIEVTAGAATAANPFLHETVKKMWARMYAPWRRNAVWLMHQDIESTLDGLAFNDAPAAGPAVPIYLPAGSVANQPYDTLKGRPVIACQECAAPGSPGDVILWSPDRYISLMRRGGLKQDVSIHVYFDFDMTAFRFVLRIGGKTLLQSPTAQRNGGNTLSSVVTIATRP